MYVRNFSEGIDVSWQHFIQTDDKAVVEAKCREAGVGFEWTAGDGLRTRQVGPAVARHPKTGETVFFNQVQLHHVYCLDAATRDRCCRCSEKSICPVRSTMATAPRSRTA